MTGTQRNQTTTSTRFRVSQFHHFSHRLAAVHGVQLKRGSARVRVTQKDGTVLEDLSDIQPFVSLITPAVRSTFE